MVLAFGERGQIISYFHPGSVLVGLVVPFVAVVGGVALLSRSPYLIIGIPVVFFWVFLWFVLTTLCLAVSWYLFDRKYYQSEGSLGDTEDREGEL